jgi:transmembrane sensor
MDLYNETVKELILNPKFRKWVLEPNSESDKIWENYLSKNPTLNREAELAKELLLKIFSDQYPLQEAEFREMWKNINFQTGAIEENTIGKKIIPINQISKTIPITKERKPSSWPIQRIVNIVAVLLISLGLGLILFKVIPSENELDPLGVISYKTYMTPPGVKSSITLRDGSKVLLNAGSHLKYRENFPENVREVFLEGEAFFEVHPNPEKPFTVKTRDISTTALGTSFNIKSYGDEGLIIALLTGRVAVGTSDNSEDPIILNEKEKINIPLNGGGITKIEFDEDEVLGWTRKLLVFNETSLPEAIRMLENWYGVSIQLENQPGTDLYISGKFYNETLQNVMDGLKHTMQLDYKIDGETVNVKF